MIQQHFQLHTKIGELVSKYDTPRETPHQKHAAILQPPNQKVVITRRCTHCSKMLFCSQEKSRWVVPHGLHPESHAVKKSAALPSPILLKHQTLQTPKGANNRGKFLCSGASRNTNQSVRTRTTTAKGKPKTGTATGKLMMFRKSDCKGGEERSHRTGRSRSRLCVAFLKVGKLVQGVSKILVT